MLCYNVPKASILAPPLPAPGYPLLTLGPWVPCPSNGCTLGQSATSRPSHLPRGWLNPSGPALYFESRSCPFVECGIPAPLVPSSSRTSSSLREKRKVKNSWWIFAQVVNRLLGKFRKRRRQGNGRLSPTPWRTCAPLASLLPPRYSKPSSEFFLVNQSGG